MLKRRLSRPSIVALALFVTFLWSTSFIIIRFALTELPPFTFAGLRYTLAFLCLLPFTWFGDQRRVLRGLSLHAWRRLIVLGLLFYAVTQGTTFFGLNYLPAVTVSLLLNFTPLIVALLGGLLLAERPTPIQWAGIVLNLVGGAIYFATESFPVDRIVALIVVSVGVMANAGSSVLGRRTNRTGEIPPLVVTVVSMGVGALVLLVTGILTEGFPRFSLASWAIIGWLAIANTALAFTLWNYTLRTLSATESSIINNTMLIQIAILAWLFLDERLTWLKVIGMMLTGLGALIVQLRGKPIRVEK